MNLVETLKRATTSARGVVRESNTLIERRGIVASERNDYRYVLWRIWGEVRSLCAFVMLNPSTADEENPDPTITKCVSFAKRWHYGGVVVVNLFARRATYPKELLTSRGPRGVHNAFYMRLVLAHSTVHRVVVAWGNHGSLNAADENFFVVHSDKECFCLQPPERTALTREGAPRHPGRIAYDSALQRVGWKDGVVKLIGEEE